MHIRPHHLGDDYLALWCFIDWHRKLKCAS
jgi:hypothetical protein